MRRASSLLSIALLTAGVLVACGSDPERPKHSPDPPVQPISQTAGGSEGGVSEAGSDAGVDTGTSTTCNDLTLGGAEVPETGVLGDPVAGSGGLLEDGTYDLITAEKFVGTGTPGLTGTTYRVTVRVTGQTLDRFVRATGANDRQVRGTFATTGAGLTYQITCPTNAQEQLTYTVNGTNLILTNTTERTAWTFVKK